MKTTAMRTLVIVVSAIACLAFGASNDSGADSQSISGIVTDANGKPVKGALLEWAAISFDTPSPAVAETRTDARGQYRLLLTEFAPGFRLSASKEGYAPSYYDHLPPWVAVFRNTNVASPPPANMDFRLDRTHSLDGTVLDEEGQPIAGVIVCAQTASDGNVATSFSAPSSPTAIPGNGMHRCVTDGQGRFHLDGLPSDRVTLSATAPHRLGYSQNRPVDVPCEIVMKGSGRAGQMRAQVVNSQTGEAVSAFSVVVRYHPQQHAFANSSGAFTLSEGITANQDYLVYVYAKGFRPTETNLTAKEIGKVESPRVEVVPAPPLNGLLVDTITQQPIPNASILYGVLGNTTYFEWGDWDKYVDGIHPLTFVQREESDESGRFSFCEDQASQGCLVVMAPGYGRAIIRPEDRQQVQNDGTLIVPLSKEAVIVGPLPFHPTSKSAVTIRIWKETNNHALDETFEKATADSKGNFEFRGLEAGTYVLGVEQFDGPWISRTKPVGKVALAAGERKNIRSSLETLNLMAQP